MKIEVWFDKNNVQITYETATAVYQKGDFVCIGYVDKELGKAVDKYPIANLFKIRESNYVTSQPR